MKDINFVGIDVDDKAYHFSIVNKGGAILAKGIRSDRNIGKLLKQIKKISGKTETIVGYEATYIGFSLFRELSKLGVQVKVIVPTSIGKSANERVKNDKIDSLKLANGLSKDDFAYVTVPTLVTESNRQLTLTRSFLVQEVGDVKRHVLSICRVNGLDYKMDSGHKEFWTKNHRSWLDKKVKALPSSMHICVTTILSLLKSLEEQIGNLNVEIENVSKSLDYKSEVEALVCFKGISTLTAMTICTEIADISRFSHPKKLVAFLGLDIREYCSGGKQLQYGISKMGNKRLRKALFESCELWGTSKTPSKRKQSKRKGVPKNMIEIADRCQARLYRKGHRLSSRGKNHNEIKHRSNFNHPRW